VPRPSLDQFLIDTEELGFSATGRKDGASDNAVRKWIRRYEREPAAKAAVSPQG
jgi:hypothetical protein